MVQYEFTRLINRLADFYERKHPKDTTMDLWFDVVASIPSNEIDHIFNTISRENESFPRNLTAAMWSIHNDFRASQGEVERHYKPCPFCNGEGEIFLQKKNANSQYYTNYVFRCDQCKQCKAAYPWGNRLFLVNQGYSEKPVFPGAEKIINVKQMRGFINSFGNLPF